MKRTNYFRPSMLIVALIFQGISIFSQPPQKVGYQAVIRDSEGNLVVSGPVGVKISILEGSSSGYVAYVETHSGTTNSNGLITLEVGNGTPVDGEFEGISWDSESHYLKVETDPTGGTNYIVGGVSQILSTPYALYSKNSGTSLQNAYRNGRIITTDVGSLEVTGSFGVVFKGNYGSGSIPAIGAGNRMMWYPRKAAFRAGKVSGTHWDVDSIGDYSVAFGNNTIAKGSHSAAFGTSTSAIGLSSIVSGIGSIAIGSYSIALGHYSHAIGNYSTSLGSKNLANGDNSIALGYMTHADGDYSTSLGGYTIASGDYSTSSGFYAEASGLYSTAMGCHISAPSFAETALGSYNTTYSPIGISEWNSDDRLFVIGNGSNLGFNSDALLILKNGNTGIGTSTPGTHRLNVLSDVSGGTSATGHFQNDNTSGLALSAQTTSSDGTVLFIQKGTGYSLRCDGYDPDWFVAMTVKGRQVGINTGSPTQNLDVNGNGRFRSIASGAYAGVVNRTSDGTLTTSTSDVRLKTNIKTLESGLDKILQLRGVTFIWIDHPEYGNRVGFIAQEFEKVIPELAFTNPTDGYKGINYAEVSAVLVEAVKELNAKVEKFQLEKNKLVERIERLEKLVSVIAGKND